MHHLDLTSCQRLVLEHIKTCILEQGYPPTRIEIQRHFGWKSANAAQDVLWALHRKGVIEIKSNLARGIKVTTLAYDTHLSPKDADRV